jgi:hypothetical protein
MIEEIENYKKIGLFRPPKKKLLDLLNLGGDEEVLINLRIFPLKNIYKNNELERYAKCVIFTNKRIFIIHRGWLINDIISFDEITDVIAMRKPLRSPYTLPVIVIKSANNLYEIFFNTFTFSSDREKIEGIIDCFQHRNSNINLKIDLKDDEWKLI